MYLRIYILITKAIKCLLVCKHNKFCFISESNNHLYVNLRVLVKTCEMSIEMATLPAKGRKPETGSVELSAAPR